MGNVHPSTSAPPPPPPAPQTPPPAPGYIENPGPLEEIHQKCKNVFPFEEQRLNLTRDLSNHHQIAYTINKQGSASLTPILYSLGARVGVEQISPTKPSLFQFDVDKSGNLNAMLVHQLTPNLQGKFGVQLQNSKFTVTKCTFNDRRPNYVTSMTVVNPDLKSGPCAVALSYLISITSNIAIGVDVSYNMKGPVLICAGKLHNEHSGMSFTLDETGISRLCYYQKTSKHLQIGVVLESNTSKRKSLVTLGYKVDIPECDLTFKGHIDWNWSVGAVLEKKLPQLPITLALSGLMNHTKNQYNLGFGIIFS